MRPVTLPRHPASEAKEIGEDRRPLRDARRQRLRGDRGGRRQRRRVRRDGIHAPAGLRLPAATRASGAGGGVRGHRWLPGRDGQWRMDDVGAWPIGVGAATNAAYVQEPLGGDGSSSQRPPPRRPVRGLHRARLQTDPGAGDHGRQEPSAPDLSLDADARVPRDARPRAGPASGSA